MGDRNQDSDVEGARRLLRSLGARVRVDRAPTLLRVGQFVATRDPRELGRVVAIAGDTASVEFFRSWSVTETADFPIRDLRRNGLWPETRVYLQDPPRVGRVSEATVEEGALSYEVRFDGDVVERIPETDLRARCMSVRVEPLDAFLARAFESQYWHDRRLAAIDAIIRMRSAARGLSGFLSASVQLVPFQLAAVQRIVSDPTQRYLLADEVGMGKTVEAAAVIRQCLLEDPRHNVLIVAPAQLLRQWTSEIEDKFRILREFPDRVTILSHDDVHDVLSDSNWELVVVDEAHRFVSEISTSTDAGRTKFLALQHLAHRSPRLLLVSATPMFGHENSALHTLNLLDPATFPLNRIEDFRSKLEHRQQIGRVLLELDTRAPVVFARRTAQSLMRMCSDDAQLAVLAERVANSDQPRESVIDAVKQLYEYVATTYRIYNRVIRGRRTDASAYFVARKGDLLIDPLEDGASELKQALDEYRMAARAALLNNDSPLVQDKELEFARRFAEVVDAAVLGPMALQAVTESRPVFPGESEAMELIVRCVIGASPGSLREWQIGALESEIRFLRLKHTRPRIVVFVSATEDARALTLALVSRGRRCQSILSTTSPDEARRQALEFRDCMGPSVLVLDRAGEEGLDLPHAHSLIHCDLPIDAGRLEQRIGRADRFGRIQGGIRQRMIIPDDDEDSYWLAWIELLRDGFGIFERSIADVHFKLEPLTNQAKLALFRSGASGLRTMRARVAGDLREERLRLDEQYALDRQQVSDFGDEADFTDLLSEDASAAARWSRGIRGWLEGVLNLTADVVRPGVFRLLWPVGTRHQPYLPERPWKERLQSGLGPHMTFDRAKALQENVALVRPGRPLLDEVEKQMMWDDRGTVFATWRATPRWTSSEPAIFFKVCVFVELPVPSVDASFLTAGVARGLRLRLDALMPPWSETLFLDVNGLPIDKDDPRVRLLESGYSKDAQSEYRDTNLAGKMDLLSALIAADALDDAVRSVHASASVAVRLASRYKQWENVERARATVRVRQWMSTLEARHRVEGNGASANSNLAEKAIALGVLRALESPDVVVDSIGLTVLSRRRPPPQSQ
jgi:ATP-dependent helicase HepA